VSEHLLDEPDVAAGHLEQAGGCGVARHVRGLEGPGAQLLAEAVHDVARHTTATSLLEVTGGDVRLVQEVLGHANLNTLQGYTKIVDSRKQDAYRRYQEYLTDKKREG
jgi:site-specific recombinase XerC